MTISKTEAVEEKRKNIYLEKPKYIDVYLSSYYLKTVNKRFRNDLTK